MSVTVILQDAKDKVKYTRVTIIDAFQARSRAAGMALSQFIAGRTTAT